MGDLRHERLFFSAATEGAWEGARLEMKEEQGQLVVGLIPQVGFARKRGQGGWICVTEQDLVDRERPLPDEIDPGAGIRIIAPFEEVGNRLIRLLAARGIDWKKKEDMPLLPSVGSEVETWTNYRIDPIIRRCVAKVSFNYLAWVGGRDFALRRDFDEVRSYVLSGTSPGHPIVVADYTPILADDLPLLRRTDGHLLTLDWPSGASDVVGQVSFFNQIRYRVSLARYMSGLWRNIRSGHHFDIVNRAITQLFACPRP